MNKNILFYGERGIVNSIILDIGGDINKERKFLESIICGDKSKLSWAEDVVNMQYIVEPYFSEFGSPDLIIKATTNKNDNYVLFIEAKLRSYMDSALELISTMNGYFPDTYKKNSSKINIQLAFRYRFVIASKQYNNETPRFIEEKDNVFQIYKDDTRRKLKNSILIDLWNENLKDAKNYYFIAMTNDSLDVIKNNFPYDENKIIPPIGYAKWNKDKSYFGIVTYESLIENKIISREFGYFCDASSLMLFEPSSSSKSIDGKEYPELKSINIDLWNENQKILAKLWVDFIEDISGLKIKQYGGSFSLIVDGVTMIKIMAHEYSNQVYLCIRDDNLPLNKSTYSNYKKYRIGGATKRVFICYLVGSPDNLDKNLKKFVEKFIETRDINILDREDNN